MWPLCTIVLVLEAFTHPFAQPSSEHLLDIYHPRARYSPLDLQVLHPWTQPTAV